MWPFRDKLTEVLLGSVASMIREDNMRGSCTKKGYVCVPAYKEGVRKGLKPLDESAACQACGHKDLNLEYCVGARPNRWCVSFLAEIDPSWSELTHYHPHYHRRCKQCQHEWLEAEPTGGGREYNL